MRTIELAKNRVELLQIIESAQSEPVLLITDSGQEFILSLVDDFEAEVNTLRNSRNFQKFLDERMKCKVRFPIEEIEKEIDAELSC